MTDKSSRPPHRSASDAAPADPPVAVGDSPWACLRSPCIIWVVFGALLGGTFVFLAPPFSAPDEGGHWIRACHCSQGDFFGKRYDDSKAGFIGGEVPEAMYTIFEDFVPPGSITHGRPLIYQFRREAMRAAVSRVDLGPRKPASFGSQIAIYNPIVYLPASLGIAFSRSLDARPLVIYYCGRLASVAGYLLLVTLAIAVTPIHKWLMLLVAMTPMAMYLCGVYSADSVTIGLCFLTIAMVLRCVLVGETITPKDAVHLAIVLCLTALTKQTSIVFLLLFFLIPRRKFGSTRRYFGAMGGAVVLPVLLTLGWSLCVRSLYAPSLPGVDPHAQLQYVLGHPFHFAMLLCGALIQPQQYLLAIGILGNLDVGLPVLFYLLYWLALLVTACLDVGKPLAVNWPVKTAGLGIAVLTLAAIQTAMYLSWNPVGADWLVGMQPRYLLPMLPLLLLSLRKRKPNGPVARHVPVAATIPAVVLTNLVAILAMLARYYW